MAWLPSSDSLTQIIEDVLVPTTLVLSSSLNPASLGADITYTAAVSAADGSKPTGTVEFFADGVSLAPPLPLTTTESVLTITGTLDIGAHVIEARYLP